MCISIYMHKNVEGEEVKSSDGIEMYEGGLVFGAYEGAKTINWIDCRSLRPLDKAGWCIEGRAVLLFSHQALRCCCRGAIMIALALLLISPLLLFRSLR